MIRRLLDSDSIGRPQFIAGALLLVYLGQCLWLIRVQTQHGILPTPDHALCIYEGLEQWKGGAVAGTPQALGADASAGREGHLRIRDSYDADRSPFYYLVAAAPVLVMPKAIQADSTLGQIWTATPYLFFGVMLGASLWYVSRRLYGNAGGYIALMLYCFSPAMILEVAGADSLGEMSGAWGAFGIIFTAIAVAHTLYAPREIVLWNWRRILLLGLSVALAAGTQFSLAILVLISLALMFWVAPVRPGAILAIWGAAIGVGIVLLLAFYSFHLALFGQAMLGARWVDFHPGALRMLAAYKQTLKAMVTGCPALMLALPAALITYFAWRRARYFGNTAPLLLGCFFLILTMGAANFRGQGFLLAMLPFTFVFVAGVFADLLETNRGALVGAGLCGLLGAAALWNVVQLARLK